MMSTTATTTPNVIPQGYTMVTDSHKFSRAVLPTEKYCYQLPNTKYVSYTSTKEKCLDCSGRDSSKHHLIRCYSQKCNKCTLFGHKAPQCHQDA